MDHRKAIETKAVERYLLGEMSELERHMFENHYFGCLQCAEEVRTGTAFIDNARSVFSEEAPLQAEPEADRGDSPVKPRVRRDSGMAWLSGWLRPSSLAPMAAALFLAFLTGYQMLVTVPKLRKMAAPALAAPVVLAAATRGEVPVVSVNESGQPVALSLYTSHTGGEITFEVRSEEDAVVHSGSGPAPAPGAPLVVFVPADRIGKPGAYRVVLRGDSGAHLDEYRFSVGQI